MTELPTSPRRFVWRTFTSVFLTACFLGALVSGAVLFLSPPGRVANWTDWSLGALTKHQWIAVHTSFSAVFLAVAAFHVFFNWRPLVGYFKSRVTRRFGLRLEWVLAVVTAGAIGWAAIAKAPPFGWLLAAGEQLKQGWDQPAQRAPIPHAELLTLSELAQKAGVRLELAQERLQQAGITGHAPDIVVEVLARQSHVPASRIYEVILAELEPKGRGAGRGPGRAAGGPGGGGEGAGGGGGGAGHGGGLGWKTVEQFCADEHLELNDVIANLKAKGYQADAKQTLRELAAANGFDRPFELVELMRKTVKP